MNGKVWWYSKTLWTNVIALVALVVQGMTGFVIDPTLQAYGLIGVNTLLRLVTKAPVVLH
jgi:hypothetical protein